MTLRPEYPFIIRTTLQVFLGCLFYLFFPSDLDGQDYWKEQRISVEHGLSNRFIRFVAQDSRGLTWISTNFGLNRYDGHQINVLTKESHGLQSNIVHQIILDKNESLWLVERDEPGHAVVFIDVLDPISLTVKPLQNYVHGDMPFEVTDIWRVVADSAHNLFIMTRQHDVYHFDSNSFQYLFRVPSKDINLDINASSDLITVTSFTTDTIFFWNKEKRQLSQQPRDVLIDEKSLQWLPFGQVNGNQQLMIAYEDIYPRYYAFVDGNGFTALRSFPVKFIRHLSGYDVFKKRLWMKNGEQIDLLNLHTGMMENILDKTIPLWPISFSDILGVNWFQTEEGVYTLTEKPKYFKSFLENENPIQSCRGMTEGKDGKIYGLAWPFSNFLFDPATNNIQKWPMRNIGMGLDCTTDSYGNIWIGAEGNICHKFSPSTGGYWSYKMMSSNLYMASWCVQHTRSGHILFGTSSGLWIKNPVDELDPVQFSKLNGFDMLNKSSIMHIHEMDEGLWLSTDNGLFLVDLDRGVLQHVDEASTGLPNNNLLFLHADDDNIFWMASRGGGLIRWDRSQNTFRTYTVSEGLSHNIIYAIYEDEFGFLWMPSDFGLMRFEKKTGISRTFLKSEGLPHEEFNRSSYFRDSKGNLYFGGLNGFISFHPKDLLEVSSIKLPVQLIKFQAINEKTGEAMDLTHDAYMSKELRLSPNVSSFVIHYSILDYDDPKLKRYAYRIDGLNTNWTYLTENFIRINGLRGGQYQVRIKGQSSTGQWSENELVIPVIIMKPFLARWYSQLGMLALAGVLFYFIYRRYSKLQKARLEHEQAVSQQLRQSDKLKDQFLANTSHELRTPLNGIVGLSESLLEKAHTEEEREDLELIISSGRRLSNLVNDILDFSRLKEHDLQIKKHPVDIHAIAELCIRMNRHSIDPSRIVLKNNISSDIPYCLADENRLQQILQNLIGNAIKFTSEGSITIDAFEADGMIVTTVSDTGIGIEKEKQEIIFREFEQADGTIAREYGGTGLGLSITKYLVELHGGDIGVVSEPGKGSVFTFTIPMYIENGENKDINHDTTSKPPEIPELDKVANNGASSVGRKGSTTTTSIENSNDDSRKHILIVDDEPVNLKVLKNHLESAGYLVTLAHDGSEALQLLEGENQFNLVLLDVMMPRIPGYEVCQKIREKYLLTELPVIMVTAKNQVGDLVEGLGNGANDYIVKPFSKDELLARVKTQIDNHDIHVATNRFVPHEFIQSLGRKNIMDLHRGDMTEHNVHVMFSDIRGYTALSEDMTPSENFRFVNALAGKVGPIVKQNHGLINQYLGDTIMMLYMQKADHGVQAGLEILRMISTYNEERQLLGRLPIRLGIGLHSGPLMMGIIGDSLRTDAAVISDTVNTASRMEGLTKHFSVNFILSGDTLNKIDDRDKFNLRYMGKVQAKGKYHSLEVYECFDGDSPEQVRLKKSSLQYFHAGMEAYFAKDMMNARKYFDQVYHANPADMTAFGFLHKINGYLSQGLPDAWTGVEVMESK